VIRKVGLFEGTLLGVTEGALDGTVLGAFVGIIDGAAEEGSALTEKVGLLEGVLLGGTVGVHDGIVGNAVGTTIGWLEGALLGSLVGALEDNIVGDIDGVNELGTKVIGHVGSTVGNSLGIEVKIFVGLEDGDCVKMIVQPPTPAS